MSTKTVYHSEKERMLAGELYNGRDAELLARHLKARRLSMAHAACDPADKDTQQALLEELLGHVGKDVWIEGPFFCDYGENIFLGDNTFLNMNCVFLDCNYIRIGKNCLLGPAVQLYAVSHPLDAAERMRENPPEGEGMCVDYSAPITIGDNCWLGGHVVVVQGVRIGNNVTIGAGSVVTKDVPDNVLAVGNPCRVIRELPPR